ncbi:MAG: hypothetical protein JWR10_3798 [Rubritepida sp.]|nr:hypothetical protein [Rubritepida sp.]
MCSDIAIRVSGLQKAYRIYPAPADRLRQSIYPRLKRRIRRFLPFLSGLVEERNYFTDFWALRDISFEVARGETVGIIGRNGSGKSTLLQLVCGTLSPTQGEVSVKGRVAALLELGSGFNPEYTGRENVLLNASVLGLSHKETLGRMDAILAFAEIGDFIDQPIKTYSSGMAMRLAFAVIAHVDADVLIIDEALAVGDVIFQQKCFRWLREFQARGTLLYCGHDTGAILGLCNRAIWLDRGELRLLGTAREVVDGYSVFTQTGELPPIAGASASSPALTTGITAEALPADPASNRIAMQGERTSYGSGLAEITAVSLSWTNSESRAWFEGGEEVELALRIEARSEIHEGIAGFIIKDRLGQSLLGDNTTDLAAAQPLSMRAGEVAEARFRFRIPRLSSGHYTISPAFASGTQQNHVAHHWIHDALVLDVHSPREIGTVMIADSSSRTIALLGAENVAG